MVKSLLFILILGASLCAFADDRLKEMEQAFAEAAEADVDMELGNYRSSQLVYLIQKRSSFPKERRFMWWAPGQNPYEWMIIRLLRPDVEMVVFFENEKQIKTNQDFEQFKQDWEVLQKHHPGIIRDKKFSREQLWKMIEDGNDSKRLQFVADFKTTRDANGKAIPKADFLLALMPVKDTMVFLHQLKPGASGWVNTELYNIFKMRRENGNDYQGWKPLARSHLTTFMAPKNRAETCQERLAGLSNSFPNIIPLIFRMNK